MRVEAVAGKFEPSSISMELLPEWIGKHPRISSIATFLLFVAATVKPTWELFSDKPLFPTIADWISIPGIGKISLELVPYVVLPLGLGLLVLIWISTIDQNAPGECPRTKTLADDEPNRARRLTEYQTSLARQAEINRQVMFGKRYGVAPLIPPLLLTGLSVSFDSTENSLAVVLTNTTNEPLNKLEMSIAKRQLWSPHTSRFVTYSDLSSPIVLTHCPKTLEPETPIHVPLIRCSNDSVTLECYDKGNYFPIPMRRFGIYKFEFEFLCDKGTTKHDVFLNFQIQKPPQVVDDPSSAK
jgi:hypothetical protein